MILAFPAKSPNRQKVLGSLPDLAERIALDFLRSMCEHIGHFYEPGARITVCSDGHVFGDLISVSDEAISSYRSDLEALLVDIRAHNIDLYSLDDAFGAGDFTELRRKLEENYAATVAELRQQIATSPATKTQFNGIHRFVFEDLLVLRPETSRTQLRLASKDLAYQIVRRSNAWSRLVAEQFPSAVRLSIHPQPCHSEKIGIHMIRTRDNWLTPWHGVAMDDGNRVTLIKRSTAEKLNASVVWRNGRPSHFVAPHLMRTDSRVKETVS